VELVPGLRAAVGLEQPRAGGARDWLLSAAERGNDATRLRAWTEGNAARRLVHGAAYLSVLAEALDRAGEGDSVLFAGWRADADELLAPDGPTVAQALTRAAERGALVRGLLWRSHPTALGYHLEANRAVAAAVVHAGGAALLDQRVRAGQPPPEVRGRPQAGTAERRRRVRRRDRAGPGSRDDADHAGDPQSVTSSARYGPRPARRDAQVELRGPAVREVDDVFRERWEDPGPLSRLPWQVLYDHVRGCAGTPRRRRPRPRTRHGREPVLCRSCARTRPVGLARHSRRTASGASPGRGPRR
jgi:phosphatidylserine/phosphatidylglycerophosphate/cardiolipin synthase-like enzyme